MFIYEFLFRGGPTSKPDDDTWHVVLARESEDITGKPRLELSDALTPARAAELGYPLERILSEINTKALNDCDEARRQRDEALQRAEQAEHRERLIRSVAAKALDKAEPAR